MEQIDQIRVVIRLLEVRHQHLIDRTLENERIVESNVAHALNTEPAGLSTSSEGLVHKIVSNEEVGLELASRVSHE